MSCRQDTHWPSQTPCSHRANKSKHLQITKVVSAREMLYYIALHYCTSVRTMPLLLRDGPSKSRHLPVLHFQRPHWCSWKNLFTDKAVGKLRLDTFPFKTTESGGTKNLSARSVCRMYPPLSKTWRLPSSSQISVRKNIAKTFAP